MAPIPTPIYHITHVKNLLTIVREGRLDSYIRLQAGAGTYVNIAHSNIQDRRATTRVSCGPGGVLHEYVPFYFAPRSPMLFAIKQGRVATYEEGQDPVVYLTSTAQAVQAAGLPFVFCDGHGTMSLTDFYDDLASLDQIDGVVMAAKYWADTVEDGDRCRRRQAEFLVHRFFPWTLITGVGVRTKGLLAQVQQCIASVAHKPDVRLRPDWYYA